MSTAKFTGSFLLCFIFLICAAHAQSAIYKTDCPYTSPKSLDKLTQRWINTVTEIHDTQSGSDRSLYNDHPIGYFQLNNNKTYDRTSNGVPLKGNWDINDNCQLMLDYKTRIQRSFDIVKLTPDTLIIRRRDENLVYVQHYKAIHNPVYVYRQ
jgi:hypothetical protein